MIDLFVDFKMYFTANPKAATLDPLENSRVNRGAQHFNSVLKYVRNASEHEAKIIAKSILKSIEEYMKRSDNFSSDF